MTILYVEENDDDLFFFGRSLKQVTPTTEWRHVATVHAAKCYLEGEGIYENRTEYPFPDAALIDSKFSDGTGTEFVEWATARHEFARLSLALFTDLPPDLREPLPDGAHYVQKPSRLGGWPRLIQQMLEWIRNMEHHESLLNAYP
jgi:hypothetical protein